MSEKPNHHSDYSINLIKKYLCVFHNNIIYITFLLSKGGHQSLILTTISTEYWAQMNLRPHCQDKYHSNECETTLPWQVSLKWMWDHTAMTSITQMNVTTLPWQVSLKWMRDHTAMTSITQMNVRPHCHDKYHSNVCETTLPSQPTSITQKTWEWDSKVPQPATCFTGI